MPDFIDRRKPGSKISIGEIVILISMFVTLLYQWWDQRTRTEKLESQHVDQVKVLKHIISNQEKVISTLNEWVDLARNFPLHIHTGNKIIIAEPPLKIDSHLERDLPDDPK